MDSRIDQQRLEAGPDRREGIAKPAIAAMMLRIFGEAS